MEKKSDEVKFNPAALISLILILVSGFLFPLFTSKITLFENSLNKLTIFNYVSLFLTFSFSVKLIGLFR